MNVRTARLATTVLIAGCGFLLLCAIVQFAGVGRGYRWAADGAEVSGDKLASIDKQAVQLPPIAAFGDINTHPLFNEDRQPSPDTDDAGDAPPPPSPLNIALTGVILDDVNHVRIAMLQDKARNQSIALKVGMPLDGDQASWTLVEVRPRGAVFRSAANETTEVALETSLAQPAAPRAPTPPRNAKPGVVPPPPRPGAPPGKPPGNPRQDPKTDGANSSADLARRIEDRRRQMREDAERLRNGGKNPPPPNK
jgi:general secretion pathway protein N